MSSGTPVTLKVKHLSPTSLTRFHYSISKRKLPRAVDRNLAKRRARAVISKLSQRLKPGFEVTLFLEPALITLPFDEVESEIVFLLEKARIL